MVNFVVWFNFLKLPRQHEILLWFCWGPKIGVSDYSLIPAGGDTNDMKSWKEGLLSDNKKDFHKYLRILSPCFYLKCQQEFQYIILKSSEGNRQMWWKKRNIQETSPREKISYKSDIYETFPQSDTCWFYVMVLPTNQTTKQPNNQPTNQSTNPINQSIN